MIIVGLTVDTSTATDAQPEADGEALIRELLECDGLGYWDEDVLRSNLEQDEQEQIEFLQEMIAGCHLAKTATPEPQPALIATPLAQLECPTNEESVYGIALGQQMVIIGNAGIQAGELFGRADNPFLMGGSNPDDWIVAISLEMVRMEVASDIILGLEPPDSMKHIDAAADALGYYTKKAVDQFTYGIDNLDLGAFEEGTTFLEYGHTAAISIGEYSEAFCP